MPEQTTPAPSPTSGTPAIPETPTRPDWLPEKFKTEADLVTAYKELETKLGQANAKPPTESEAAQAEADAVSPPPDQVPQRTTVDSVLARSGLSKKQLLQEYQANNGKLADDTYKVLEEEQNYSREIVDQFLAGQQAQSTQEWNEVFKETPTGGSDWGTVSEWLGQNTPQEDINGFNSLMEGSDTSAKKIAIRDAYARYAEANGSEGNLLQGQGAPGGPATYSHYDEYRMDVRNPEYSKNAAFRNKVTAKLARSKHIL